MNKLTNPWTCALSLIKPIKKLSSVSSVIFVKCNLRKLKKLQAEQRLSRHEPAKGGYWDMTK